MPYKHSRCPGCHKKRPLTRHHIFPRRHWQEIARNNRWSGHPPPPIILLCRKCHDKIEGLIPYEIQPYEFYWEITKEFLCLLSVEEAYMLAGLPFYWGEIGLENPILIEAH
ncbi:MAG: hypothetical protein WCX70_01315 [Candidatus Paceibacterota bacterium]|jgi:hypothetical protein